MRSGNDPEFTQENAQRRDHVAARPRLRAGRVRKHLTRALRCIQKPGPAQHGTHGPPHHQTASTRARAQVEERNDCNEERRLGAGEECRCQRCAQCDTVQDRTSVAQAQMDGEQNEQRREGALHPVGCVSNQPDVRRPCHARGDRERGAPQHATRDRGKHPDTQRPAQDAGQACNGLARTQRRQQQNPQRARQAERRLTGIEGEFAVQAQIARVLQVNPRVVHDVVAIGVRSDGKHEKRQAQPQPLGLRRYGLHAGLPVACDSMFSSSAARLRVWSERVKRLASAAG